MSASVIPAAVTDAQFEAAVLRSPVPVLVDVWAAWCQPCVTLTPVIHRLAETYRDRLTVLTLDADSNLDTVTTYDIRALPTVLVFDRGALVARQTGAQSYHTYAELLDTQLAARATGAPVVALPHGMSKAALRPTGDPHGSPATAEAQALAAALVPTLIFKHSATCSISIGVKQEYDTFVREFPGVPVRLVVVQQERPLSNAIADVLRVEHESPQAIVVHNGQVVWHASHRRITASRIAEAITAAASGAR
ncbi:bacillithiol system redox-active protein YtxJ [Gemmatimonas sp.]|jgi:thioredoxin 1|uniref:bacillithiol system redox-active protein YtxJ n=1 Tax=Gemmatimonas sp. TaxID=1962908 RepID=UPI0037BF4BDD